MSELIHPIPKPLPLWVADTLASPDPQWIVPGFIPAQGLVIIAGRPKIAKKSWMAYALAMAAASGKPVGPFLAPQRTNVLFYSREGAAGPIAHRFNAIERAMGPALAQCDNIFFVQNGAFFLDEPLHIKGCLKFIAENRIGLVVIDTLAKSFRGDENNARDVGAALRGVEKIRDAGAATLLVHHLGKSKIQAIGGVPDPDAGLRGSSALAGAYDNIISIQQLEVDGESEVWAVVGGKYLDFHGYKQDWEITQDKDKNPNYARLDLEGPQELPVVENQQPGARF
jgi:RecA-family ATPase